MSSPQSPSHATGFEAYIATLASRASQKPACRLNPDFVTWEACFDFVASKEPLMITLPGGGKTNLELMRFMDALRKRALVLVDVGDKPGRLAMCTSDQAEDVKAHLPPTLARSRYYLSSRS